MNDPYLYEGSSVLRNLLNIHDEKELDIAEAELSQANMMLLYEQGFEDFTTLSTLREYYWTPSAQSQSSTRTTWIRRNHCLKAKSIRNTRRIISLWRMNTELTMEKRKSNLYYLTNNQRLEVQFLSPAPKTINHNAK